MADFTFYTDELMTVAAPNPYPIVYDGIQSKYVVLYFGSPTATEALKPDPNAGQTEILITPASSLKTFETNHQYHQGEIVQPSVPDSYMYHCTTGGTTGAYESSWNTTSGGATIQGSAIFTNKGKAFLPTDIKMALSQSGLDTAVGGNSLSLGNVVTGGAAVAVHIRFTNPDDLIRRDDTDPSIVFTTNSTLLTSS